MITEIITGEKVQQICDLYIGNLGDFSYNPIIANQTNKHLNINSINQEFDNPYYIFCYSHLINQLSVKINYFKNNFILITHNSDQNIENNEKINTILKCNNVVKWYAQNLVFEHEKLHLLPIGLANSMWSHGNLQLFNDNNFINNIHNKTKFIYFNFKIITNINKRQPCYDQLKDKLEWLNNITPVENLCRLKDYQFCICPEGNGVDTHRLWECLYLKVVPIVIDSPFSNILKKYNIPLVILNNWSDVFNTQLVYEDYNFDDEIFKNLSDFNKLIKQIKT
jgi:hypothetical protein